jgi:AcrR family transcriptional regulator
MKKRFVRGADTRMRIIRTAADLLHRQGARSTSPDEIIEASRTGKGQFYHYFKSKEGLIHEVLQTLQKLLSIIQAGMICRPSRAAFFLRNSTCCWRFLCS